MATVPKDGDERPTAFAVLPSIVADTIADEAPADMAAGEIKMRAPTPPPQDVSTTTTIAVDEATQLVEPLPLDVLGERKRGVAATRRYSLLGASLGTGALLLIVIAADVFGSDSGASPTRSTMTTPEAPVPAPTATAPAAMTPDANVQLEAPAMDTTGASVTPGAPAASEPDAPKRDSTEPTQHGAGSHPKSAIKKTAKSPKASTKKASSAPALQYDPDSLFLKAR